MILVGPENHKVSDIELLLRVLSAIWDYCHPAMVRTVTTLYTCLSVEVRISTWECAVFWSLTCSGPPTNSVFVSWVTPKSLSMASREMPLVSGTKNHTKKNMVKQKLPKIRYVLRVKISARLSTLTSRC